MLQLARLEIELMKKINSPYSVKLYADQETDECFWLVMEYCNYDCLTNFIHLFGKGKPYLPEQKARVVMQKIIKGVNHVQSSGVIHRDLKPANLLVHMEQIENYESE